MQLKHSIPSGLKNRQCERFDPIKMGGLPPIRFVATARKDEPEDDGETTKQNSVKIKINDKITKNFRVFVKGDAAAVVQLIRDHESIVDDTKLRETWKAASDLVNTKKSVLKTLDKSKKSEIDNLRMSIAELLATCKSAQDEAFDYFEKLLDRAHVPKWREIVRQECEEVPYIDFNGKKITAKPRGKVFDALEACYLKVMLQVVPQDAAERHRRYWQTTIKKAEEISCRALIEHMQWANSVTKYLPCMKHMEDSPAALPQMNVPFSEMEMCTNVIAALPQEISTAYWAAKGQHFPVCLKTLGDDLKMVEAQEKRREKNMNELRAQAGLPPKGAAAAAAKKKRMADADQRIPKKPRGDDAKSSPPTRSKKHCALCAKHSPDTARTHNTKDCRKWLPNGQPKPWPDKAKKTNAHSHDEDVDMKACFAQMRKEQNALKRLLLKRVKTRKSRKKRRRKYESDSDSDSTSSDDE